MKQKKYIISLDQGTTSSRTILFDSKAGIVAESHIETTQIYPNHGWVEQDPEEIFRTQMETLNNVLVSAKVDPGEIAAIGIANQRETTVIWDKNTGKPVYNAIVWQDVRTTGICKAITEAGHAPYIKETTGLVVDSYFSATKIQWILDHVEGVREKAEKGDLLFGTIDTWLLWKMTGGKVHATDFSNASRTMLFDIRKLKWDDKILGITGIPKTLLPEVRESVGDFGTFNFEGTEIPITGVAGDQQSALFGQACFEKGDTKNTYGTGCFLLMNTGGKPQFSDHGMLTTVAWGIDGDVNYALEGSVFVGGAAIQWLRDGLKMIDTAADSEYYAKKVQEPHEVFVVPAFSGLGAPFWDMDARGAIFGITRDTTKDHLIKATLESIAYQSKDLLLAMEEDAGTKLTTLKVDGGASANNYLMQFQADILNTKVERPEVIETTALGVAFMAGIGAGLWKKEDILKQRRVQHVFAPQMKEDLRTKLFKKWRKAVKKSMDWED